MRRAHNPVFQYGVPNLDAAEQMFEVIQTTSPLQQHGSSVIELTYTASNRRQR